VASLTCESEPAGITCTDSNGDCHISHTSLRRLECSMCPATSDKSIARLSLSLIGGQTVYRLGPEIRVADVIAAAQDAAKTVISLR
jgi:hypothetical protein